MPAYSVWIDIPAQIWSQPEPVTIQMSAALVVAVSVNIMIQ